MGKSNGSETKGLVEAINGILKNECKEIEREYKTAIRNYPEGYLERIKKITAEDKTKT